jgi:hypothetical protein
MAQNKKTIAAVLDDTQEITADSLTEGGGRERRQFTRRATSWRATLTTKNKVVVQCKTRDISERGASIASPANVPANTIGILHISAFYNGVKKDFKILAEVKHTSIAKDGFTLGIFFKDASQATFNFFKKYATAQI